MQSSYDRKGIEGKLLECGIRLRLCQASLLVRSDPPLTVYGSTRYTPPPNESHCLVSSDPVRDSLPSLLSEIIELSRFDPSRLGVLQFASFESHRLVSLSRPIWGRPFLSLSLPPATIGPWELVHHQTTLIPLFSSGKCDRPRRMLTSGSQSPSSAGVIAHWCPTLFFWSSSSPSHSLHSLLS